MIYLYLKTHNISGLKYLGKTTRDPQKYLGSGKVWRDHLKKYGNDIHTEILFETDNQPEIEKMGKYYSELWNIVESKKFANLVPEHGDGGSRKDYPGYKLGIANRKSLAGKNNPNYGSVYKLVSPKDQIYLVESKIGLKKFCKEHNLSFWMFVKCMAERRSKSKYGRNYKWTITKIDNNGESVLK